jgi:hypothetical protein
MKRTTAVGVIIFLGVGLAIGLLGEALVVARNSPMVVPPYSLPLTLAALAVLVLTFGISTRRAITGKAGREVDPFSAMRLVAVAKASSRVGALVLGFGIGVLCYFFARPVSPPLGSIVAVAVTAGAAAFLLVAGLVAEHLCMLPPDDRNDDSAPPTA